MKRLIVLLAMASVLSACSYSRQVQRRTNLMSYLYPQAQAAPEPDPQGAALQLPLKVGIAFVPSDDQHREALSADQQEQLLNIVRDSFKDRDWVREIVIIPTTYLRSGGGFENLDQATRMFGTDVFALVSVDQIQNSNPTRASCLYLTIIGAYVLPLDRNDTRTLIDAAVFHVPSRTFLLRAPGTNHLQGYSAAVDVSETMAAKAERSFTLAMKDLAANLDTEIRSCKAEVASGERKDVDIVTREGTSVRSGGSASFGPLGALAAMILAVAIARSRR